MLIYQFKAKKTDNNFEQKVSKNNLLLSNYDCRCRYGAIEGGSWTMRALYVRNFWVSVLLSHGRVSGKKTFSLLISPLSVSIKTLSCYSKFDLDFTLKLVFRFHSIPSISSAASCKLLKNNFLLNLSILSHPINLSDVVWIRLDL